jgi:hypothetical protein
MGTRADFYVGKGAQAEWLGSKAFDGGLWGIPDMVLNSNTEEEYRTAIAEFFKGRKDVTHPEEGWPWPWEDSQTSDYAYTFAPWDEGIETGCVWVAIGMPNRWLKVTEDEPEWDDWDYEQQMSRLELCVHPNMKERMNVQWGEKSGLLIVRRT